MAVACQRCSRWVVESPENVHYGRAAGSIEDHQDTLLAAYEKHPERFKYRMPKPMMLPDKVWINKPLLTSDREIHQMFYKSVSFSLTDSDTLFQQRQCSGVSRK
jgi:hypothetical protein